MTSYSCRNRSNKRPPPASGTWRSTLSAMRSPPLFRLGEIDRRQVPGIELRHEAAFARAVQRLVIDEQLARRIEALDAQLAAHDLDEALMLDAILRKEIRRAGFQRVDGEKLVAVAANSSTGGQSRRRRSASENSKPSRATRRDGRAARDRRRSDRASVRSVPPELG